MLFDLPLPALCCARYLWPGPSSATGVGLACEPSPTGDSVGKISVSFFRFSAVPVLFGLDFQVDETSDDLQQIRRSQYFIPQVVWWRIASISFAANVIPRTTVLRSLC